MAFWNLRVESTDEPSSASWTTQRATTLVSEPRNESLTPVPGDLGQSAATESQPGVPLVTFFLVFAALNVLALSAAVWLASDICRAYAVSTQTTAEWVVRRTQFGRLRQSMRDMNLAVGSALVADETTEAVRSFLAARSRLAAQLERARGDLHAYAGESSDTLAAELAEIGRHAEQAAQDAAGVFAAVDRGDSSAAGKGAATVYQSLAAAHRTLDSLFETVRGAHESVLAEERRVGERNGRRLTGIVGILLAMIGVAVIWGYKLSGRCRRDDLFLRSSLRAAQAAARAKAEFLANTSHEIRTPLTAVLGFAEQLEASDVSPAQHREMVAAILRNGEHLLAVIDDILDLSKIDAGTVSIERADVSVPQVLADVTAVVRTRAEQRGLKFNLEFSGPLPSLVVTDARRLRQILINLLGNAVKFTTCGDVRLVVGFDPRDGQGRGILQFDVIDTGVGIMEGRAQHLFQPFAQADASLTRRYGGSGLGLAISRRLARLLGGDVVLVRSDRGGSHSRATVEVLPAATSVPLGDPTAAVLQAPREPRTDALRDGSPLGGCRVLLVEDGIDNQRLITMFLRRAGADVALAADGQEAVRAALQARSEGHCFDVILMDMQMPRMDGYEATSLLRHEGYEGTIIALTAHAMSGDRQRCLAAGCDDYATKPIQRSALVRTILHHIRSGEPLQTA